MKHFRLLHVSFQRVEISTLSSDWMRPSVFIFLPFQKFRSRLLQMFYEFLQVYRRYDVAMVKFRYLLMVAYAGNASYRQSIYLQ